MAKSTQPERAPAPVSPRAAPVPSQSKRQNSRIGFITFALFVTTFCQTGQLAKLPIQFILKDELSVKANEMALFLAVILIPWYAKPLFGMVADSIPLLGSRRRIYLILSALAAAACWIGMALAPRRFGILLGLGILLNCFIMAANAVVGGLLVYEGCLHGITGRLASMRVFVKNGAMLLAGPVGGFLATRAFGWTTGLAAGLYCSLALLTALAVREDVAHRESGVLSSLYREFKVAGTSRGLLITAGMLFLVHIEPGFGTPLFYVQTESLHFTSTFIGGLAVLYGIFALLAAAVYMRACQFLSLRLLLIYSIICTALTTVPYLAYHSRPSAIWIEMIAGFGAGLAQLPLFDLAARATPRGRESLGYAIMMSVWNLGMSVSDLLGSWLFENYHLTFHSLIWLNAATTLLVLFFIPAIPQQLISGREGEFNWG